MYPPYQPMNTRPTYFPPAQNSDPYNQQSFYNNNPVYPPSHINKPPYQHFKKVILSKFIHSI